MTFTGENISCDIKLNLPQREILAESETQRKRVDWLNLTPEAAFETASLYGMTGISLVSKIIYLYV